MLIAAFVVPIVMLAYNLLQQSPANDLSDYLERIARVQSEQVVDWSFTDFETPTRRDFYIPIERLTIGLIESAELRKCDLLELVYLHNDALGKVQDEFRNLDYQVAVLSGLKRCIQQGELSPTLTNKLRAIYQLKWQQLPFHINNTLLYSTASHKQMYSEQWLPMEEKVNTQFYRDYAGSVKQLLDGYKEDDLPLNFSLVSFQETLEKQRVLGQLFYSLHATNQWLERINHQLSHFDGSVQCDPNGNNQQLVVMMNVFSHIYVDKLQPYFSHLSNHYFAVAPLLEIYQHPFVNQNSDYLLDLEYGLFKQHLKTHVSYWTSLRERCGLSMQQLIGEKRDE